MDRGEGAGGARGLSRRGPRRRLGAAGPAASGSGGRRGRAARVRRVRGAGSAPPVRARAFLLGTLVGGALLLLAVAVSFRARPLAFIERAEFVRYAVRHMTDAQKREFY